MPTQSFDFTGAGGQRLAGRLECPEGEARAYALFAHCFTCTKSSLAATRIARALTQKGIGVLRFDFTGLGESEGNLSESGFSGNVADLLAAIRHMDAQGVAPRLLIGHSLGGAAVLAAAAETPSIAAIAVIAAPFEAEHVTKLMGDGLAEILEKGEATVNLGGRPFTIRRSFIEDLRAQDQATRIAALRRPLLILQSPQDQIVEIGNATKIFLAAHHPKSFVALDHADHLLTRAADADYAADVIAAWASHYLPAPAAPLVVDGAVVEETGGGRYQVQIAAGPARFLADEPAAVGGLRSGPTPYELLSAGLGACTAMTLRMYADRKGWSLAPVRVSVSHAKSNEDKNRDVFSRQITIAGPIDDEQRARLLEIADRCPVHRTLTEGSDVVTALSPEPAPPCKPDTDAEAMERATEN